ncbi:hypothetical protein LWI28_016494 [Acer negundo]|uniref:Uncharacterized protein n=1 Tax=Acer negundo TaxID=4023 RepID=A0AAD5J0J6_ACENE|nr:hypothetical protein LWI28_016494 [Acer negundo]
MSVPIQVTASSGIDSSIVTTVKPGVNSSSVPAENLVLRDTCPLDLVSSSDPVVLVVFIGSDSKVCSREHRYECVGIAPVMPSYMPEGPSVPLDSFQQILIGMASVVSGLEVVVVSPSIGIDTILVPIPFLVFSLVQMFLPRWVPLFFLHKMRMIWEVLGIVLLT